MNSVHSARRGAPPAGERLTRDAVLAGAEQLIEQDGAAAFSLRSLAKALDVRPAALYNHVRGRDDLLDAVTERFVASFGLTEGDQAWPDWIRSVACELRGRMLEHSALTGLLLSRAPATSSGAELLRRFLDRLVSCGVDRAVAHVAWHAMFTAVIGAVQQEHARNRHQEDTFAAVLEVTVNGIVAAAAQPATARAEALLEAHYLAHGLAD